MSGGKNQYVSWRNQDQAKEKPNPYAVLFRDWGVRYEVEAPSGWESLILGKSNRRENVSKILDATQYAKVNPFDFRDYSENFIKIVDKNARLCSFRFNKPQEKLWKIFQEELDTQGKIRVAILKARQEGMSTFIDNYFLFKSATTPYYSSAIIAHDEGGTKNLFDRVKLAYDYLPPPIKPMRKFSNRRELLFENPETEKVLINPGLQSKLVTFTGGSKKAGISYTFHAVHISELAEMDNPETYLAGLYPAISNEAGTAVVYEYTAHGMNFGYDFWCDCERGQSGFRPVFFSWLEMPEYSLALDTGHRNPRYNKWSDELDEEEKWLVGECGAKPEQLYWRREVGIKEICKGRIDDFHQYYPAVPEQAFVSTGNFVFPVDGIKQQEKKVLVPRRGELEIISHKDYLFRDGAFGMLRLFEEPKQGFCYAIGVDVAEGHEVRDKDYDYSVISVIRRKITDAILLELGRKLHDHEFIGDINKPCFVAHWHGNLYTHLFADLLEAMGWWYNNAWVNVERNGAGNGVLDQLRDRYMRIMYETRTGERGEPITKKLGFRTSRPTKAILISDFVEAIEQSKVYQPDQESLDEYKVYVNKEGIFAAEQGKHDDYVIADSLAWRTHLKAPMSRPANMPQRRRVNKRYEPMCDLTGY